MQTRPVSARSNDSSHSTKRTVALIIVISLGLLGLGSCASLFVLGQLAIPRHEAGTGSDPVVNWKIFFGGWSDSGKGVAVDGNGDIYVTGYSDVTWGQPIRPFSGGPAQNAFVAKMNPSGTLIWNTFLGDKFDEGQSIALDGKGNIYVTGQSWEPWGLPVRPFTGATTRFTRDAFVAKLDPSGQLIWHTFLGGSGTDVGKGIGLDAQGNVYVSGYSDSPWGAPLSADSDGDAFVAKLDPSGNLAWNTFLVGDNDLEEGHEIAVDSSGNSYVTGYSSSTWGQPVQAYTGYGNAFVAKLDSSGKVVWNTFLGDYKGYDITIDSNGNSYVTGVSYGTWGTPVRAFQGWSDAFVAKLDPTGDLIWNTFLGEKGTDEGYDIAVDSKGNTYVTGFSEATSPLGFQLGDSFNYWDPFVAKLDATGQLIWNTTSGESGSDTGRGIAVDTSGNGYVTGDGGHIASRNAKTGAFLARISDLPSTTTPATPSGGVEK